MNHHETCGKCHSSCCEHTVAEWMKQFDNNERDESKEVKYVPTAIYCVWVVDKDKEVSFVGQVPRDGLDEGTVELPDWVYAERDYGDDYPPERIYQVRFGSLEEYLAQFLASKMANSSFKIAGLEVY